MKRVLVFLGLKIAEISAVVFIPHYLGRAFIAVTGLPPDSAPFWIVGWIPILTVFLFVLTCAAIPEIISANWRWSKDILERGKE